MLGNDGAEGLYVGEWPLELLFNNKGIFGSIWYSRTPRSANKLPSWLQMAQTQITSKQFRRLLEAFWHCQKQ